MPLLAGQNVLTSYTGTTDLYGSAVGELSLTFTAVASGVASEFKIYMADWWTTDNIKVRLRDSAGNLLDEATLNSAAGVDTLTAALSGGVSLVSGTDYILGFVADTGYVKPYHDATTYEILGQTSSTYASAQDPLVAGAAQSSSNIAMWVEGGSPPSRAITSSTDPLVSGSTGNVANVTAFLETSTLKSLKLGGVSLPITSWGNNAQTQSFPPNILQPLVQGGGNVGSAITSLGGVDFDGLADGASITSLVSFYGAYGNGYGAQGDTVIKYGSNSSSANLSIESGTTGRPGDGAPAGNGDFGFIYSLTDEGDAVANGGELWVYGKLYIPAGFDFSGAGGLGLKFLRFTFPSTGGKLDVHIGENGSGVNNSFSISNENYSQFQTDVHRETNKTLNLGAWNDFCFFVSATADTATTDMKLWMNDEFVMEHVGNGSDITTNWINPAGTLDSATWTPAGGAFAALPTVGDTISSMYLFTYWNGNAPQDQSVNVQYMQYVQSDVDLSTDEYGNKYVNSGQVQ